MVADIGKNYTVFWVFGQYVKAVAGDKLASELVLNPFINRYNVCLDYIYSLHIVFLFYSILKLPGGEFWIGRFLFYLLNNCSKTSGRKPITICPFMSITGTPIWPLF